MTALKHDVAPAQTTSVRPPDWVTDEVLDRLTARVFRDPAGSSDPLHPVAPYDGQVTATIPTSTADDVTRAVDEARAGAAAWRARSYADRAAVMLRFHDLFVERQDEVIDLIQWEMGKARFSAWQEILQVANIARHYARVGEKYLSPTSVRGAVPGLTQVQETRVPKGVVGVISPWNYPFYLGVGDVIPALLAGNAVVSKADSQTALTLLHARDLMAEAGLPADAWHVVAGPRQRGRHRADRRGRLHLLHRVDRHRPDRRRAGGSPPDRRLPRARRQEPADRAQGRRPPEGGRGLRGRGLRQHRPDVHPHRARARRRVRLRRVPHGPRRGDPGPERRPDLRLHRRRRLARAARTSSPPSAATSSRPGRPARPCSPVDAPVPTSDRSSTSRPCSRVSPTTWRCAPRRPSAR